MSSPDDFQYSQYLRIRVEEVSPSGVTLFVANLPEALKNRDFTVELLGFKWVFHTAFNCSKAASTSICDFNNKYIYIGTDEVSCRGHTPFAVWEMYGKEFKALVNGFNKRLNLHCGTKAMQLSETDMDWLEPLKESTYPGPQTLLE